MPCARAALFGRPIDHPATFAPPGALRRSARSTAPAWIIGWATRCVSIMKAIDRADIDRVLGDDRQIHGEREDAGGHQSSRAGAPWSGSQFDMAPRRSAVRPPWRQCTSHWCRCRASSASDLTARMPCIVSTRNAPRSPSACSDGADLPPDRGSIATSQQQISSADRQNAAVRIVLKKNITGRKTTSTNASSTVPNSCLVRKAADLPDLVHVVHDFAGRLRSK